MCLSLILATLKRGPGECKEEKLTRGHIRKPRDFLDVSLCERLSVLCGVIAQSRAFKPSDGHTALPCGLLQLSLCVPQPSPLCPLCPAEGRMNNLPAPQGGGYISGASRKVPPGAAPRPRQGSKGLTDIYNEHSNVFSTNFLTAATSVSRCPDVRSSASRFRF